MGRQTAESSSLLLCLMCIKINRSRSRQRSQVLCISMDYVTDMYVYHFVNTHEYEVNDDRQIFKNILFLV